MNKGVLLIAIGHPDYVKMAVNLAASIKATDKDCPIALVHNESSVKALRASQEFLFDHLIECPEEAFTTDGKTEYIKVKTWMYKLSPFKETLFLDVDMIWFMQVSPLKAMEKLSNYNWTMSSTGKAEFSVWCDLEEVKKVYNSEDGFWNYHSEFVYFKKCTETRKYFNEVQKRFANPQLKTLTNFGGARLADELAFQLASIVTGQYPHKEVFNPVMWFARDRRQMNLRIHELKHMYLAYSVGGHRTPNIVKDYYNKLAAAAFIKVGLHYPYKLKDKRNFIPERSKI